MSIGPAEVGLILAGVAIGGLGGWLLLFRRPKRRAEGDTSVPSLTEPTRLTIAMICLIAGYNLILWALPPKVAAVQLPRSKWYIWILIGISMVVVTLLLDQMDGRRSESSTKGPDRP
jgi:hypothetical protein